MTVRQSSALPIVPRLLLYCYKISDVPSFYIRRLGDWSDSWYVSDGPQHKTVFLVVCFIKVSNTYNVKRQHDYKF